jgi:hypothetical protein
MMGVSASFVLLRCGPSGFVRRGDGDDVLRFVLSVGVPAALEAGRGAHST